MTYGAAHRLNGLMILGLLCLFVAYRNPHPQTIADLIGKRVDILSDSLWAGCRSMAIERIKARL